MAELKEKIYAKAKLNNEHAQYEDKIYSDKKHADPKLHGTCELLIFVHKSVYVCVHTYVYMCVHVSCVCMYMCVHQWGGFISSRRKIKVLIDGI